MKYTVEVQFTGYTCVNVEAGDIKTATSIAPRLVDMSQSLSNLDTKELLAITVYDENDEEIWSY